ncbi:hypothetical protein GCM10022381_28500 [Leifsonia kafniensis]|uniref:DUF4190 domain-containing protein n=1 Tax=Leifsonia kafniensis TaxID=475957 RepID=A0ABP7KPF3_9MICO
MTDPNLPAVPPNDGVGSTPPSAAPQYVPAPPAADAYPPAPQPGYGQQPAGSAPYGAPQYGAPQYGAPVAEEKYNVLAIVSLVSAFFVSLVAIITGHIALSQIKRTGEKGRGLAIAGLVLGYVSFVAGLIVLIVMIPFIIYVLSHPEQYSTS